MNSSADQTIAGLDEAADLVNAAAADAPDAQFAPGGFQTGPEAAYRPPDEVAEPARGEPTPLPKRPKGRIAVGLLLLIVLALVGHSLWSVFLRHSAYGVVAGRVATIAAPWGGVVFESHASEAERFEQFDLLARVDSLELRHQVDRLGDELRIAQATLDAQISRMRWEAQEFVELTARAAAQQHEAQGALAEQRALLDRYQRDRERADELNQQRAIAGEKYDLARFNEMGQREKVAELESSVDRWRQRAELLTDLSDAGDAQLRPLLAKIENLQAEMRRLRETLAEGDLHAPFDAVVVKRHKLAGERVEPQEAVVDVLQTGSLEVVLYLVQDDVDALEVGDQIQVVIEPHAKKIPCTVVRRGNRMDSAPPAIERFYWSNEPLLPVYLKPDPKYDPWLSLRLGSMAKW